MAVTQVIFGRVTASSSANATALVGDVTYNSQYASVPMPVAGTLSNWHVRPLSALASGTSRTLHLQKNGSTVVSSVTLTDTVTEGITVDGTTVAAGDLLRYAQTRVGGPANQFVQLSWDFAPDDGVSQIYAWGSGSITQSDGASVYVGVLQDAFRDTTDADESTLWGVAGTITTHYVHEMTAPGTGNSRTYTIYLNGVAQDGTGGTPDTRVTIANSATDGNASFSLTVAAGDTVSVQITNSGTPDGIVVGGCIAFEPTAAGTIPMVAGNVDTDVNNAGTYFYLPGSDDQAALSTDHESVREYVGGVTQVQMTGLRVSIPAPGSGNSRTFTVRKNRVDTDLTVTISDLDTTGSVVGAVSVTTSDTWSIKEVIVGTPTTGVTKWVVSGAPETPIIGSAVFGVNTTVTATRAIALGLDGNTNTHSEAGKFKVFGDFEVTGTSTIPGVSTPTTTKGDLIVRSATADDRLAVGTNGQVLTADSAQTLGVKWATPAAGGGGSVGAIDVERLARAMQGLALYSGCAVTEDAGGASMDVDVAAGHLRTADHLGVLVTAGSVTLDTADATNDRIDLVWVDDSGTLGKTTGTAAADPEPPAIPADCVLLAMIDVPANDTTIETAQITDKRTYTRLPQIVRKTTDETVNNSSTLQDDDELAITMGASEVWIAKNVMFFTGATAADMIQDLTVPSGATGIGGQSTVVFTSAAGNFGDTDVLSSTDLGRDYEHSASSTQAKAILDYVIINSTTPGSVTVRWAQRTANLSDLIVKAGSYLMAWPQF